MPKLEAKSHLRWAHAVRACRCDALDDSEHPVEVATRVLVIDAFRRTFRALINMISNAVATLVLGCCDTRTVLRFLTDFRAESNFAPV
jgi:hypothetical protein